MIRLRTPHISLGCSVEEALAILRKFGDPAQEVSGEERSLRVDTPLFALAVYPKNGTVASVWYDDPMGRESEVGRADKVQAYLKRYGSLHNWERRLDNGWMHYWFNPTERAQLVYGIHRDVIRLNQYAENA